MKKTKSNNGFLLLEEGGAVYYTMSVEKLMRHLNYGEGQRAFALPHFGEVIDIQSNYEIKVSGEQDEAISDNGG